MTLEESVLAGMCVVVSVRHGLMYVCSPVQDCSRVGQPRAVQPGGGDVF